MVGTFSCLLMALLVVGLCASTCRASHRTFDSGYLESLAQANKGVTPPQDNYRTGYHFQPVSHWMNDPNAPMFYKGYYHLFYQYNPSSAVWGMIRWGHAVSKDLMNWRHLSRAAIFPNDWYDQNGAWSGSATFLHHHGTASPVILYTGNTNESVQVLLMAEPVDPSDPLLTDWKKSPENPIAVPDKSINISSFRDPTTAWLGPDGKWSLLIGNKRQNFNQIGQALIYVSKDFKKWEKLSHPLHSAPTTGMWECPDFFPVDLHETRGLATNVYGRRVKHVLKNSLDNTKVDYYTVGKYNPKKNVYTPDTDSVESPNGLRYDYGKFYASKTFFDYSTNRRILWGWINESDSVADDVARGWAGVMAIPRQVYLDTETKSSLILWPVKEVESQRIKNKSMSNLVLKPGSRHQVETEFSTGAAQVDVEVEFEVIGKKKSLFTEVEGLATKTAQALCTEASSKAEDFTSGGFGLMVLASHDLKERSSVLFKFFSDKSNQSHTKVALCVDQSKSTLKKDADLTSYGGFVTHAEQKDSLSLRVLVDRSIVESFAEGGKTCITSRSYPTKAVGNDVQLFVFNHHAKSFIKLKSLKAWQMTSVKSIYEILV